MKWMTLHSGTRAIGTGIDGGLLTEGGCALHLAQDVTGEVWTVLYPFRSEMRAQREEYLVVDRTRPSKLTAGRLDRRLRQFMSYSRVTTVGHCASRRDKAVVWWARARNHYAGRSFLATIGGLVLDGLRRIPVLGKFLPRVANRLHLLDEDGQGAE